MVTLEQIANGVTKYIDTEILPHLTGIKRIGLGVYSGLAANNVAAMVAKYKDHPMVAVLDVIHDDGVDLDKLYNAVYPMFKDGQRESIQIPMIGEWQIDKTDIEHLYKYIKEA